MTATPPPTTRNPASGAGAGVLAAGVLLAADDPRHGKYAGAVAHWLQGSPLCGACQKAATRQRKVYRLRALNGIESRLSALGTHRRIQALIALGYSANNLDAALGKCRNYTHAVLRRDALNAPTVEAYSDLYERLCMTRPEGSTATRARNTAERNGWPVPLAWTDIDDPTETPTDWRYNGTDRADEFDDMLARGYWLSEVCRVLAMNVEALEKWCDRHGRRAGFNRLSARERGVA